MKKKTKRVPKPKLTNGKTVLAWHVLQGRKILAWGDHREVTKGSLLAADGKLDMCKNGLHACQTKAAALKRFFAAHPGAQNPVYICRVRLSGEILGPVKNKYCARAREVLSMARMSQKEGRRYQRVSDY